MVTPTVTYDVAVIGAGVVGAAIARELSQYRLRCVLLEAASDVGTGTSKANTAILHTGFDAKPGTLEARLVRRGYALLNAYGPTAGIPIEPIGALLVAWDAEQLAAPARHRRERGAQRLRRGAAGRRGRALSARAAPRPGRARRAAHSRREPDLPVHHAARLRHRRRWSTASRCASTARCSRCGRRATASTRCATPRGAVRARYVVNAAGLYADTHRPPASATPRSPSRRGAAS